ncbi:MAG: YlxR family protein [Chloroflexi bacterium]|nr:YlxR family protein [Chloroflexota bacterium]
MASKGHFPERTCVGCGDKRPKGQLVRVVRGPAGDVGVDPVGRLPGRGAYFCRFQECWELGVRKGRLDYVLRAKLSAEDRLRLAEFAQALPSKGAEA